MFDIQGMPHSEISKILGVSEGTVRSRLYYAHQLLQGPFTGIYPIGFCKKSCQSVKK